MRLGNVLSGAALALAFSLTASAQMARPSDRAVEKLIDGAQESLKRFERSLDADLKRGLIRGTSTEVNVEHYLADFNTDIERLRDRFEPGYSASAEALMVLRRANGVDAFVKSQPASLKGRSEWDVAAASFNELAGAYGTTFPMPAEAPPRRINDAEIGQAADAVAKQAGAYKKSLTAAFGKEESEQLKAAQKSADELASAAKALKSRIGSGKAASGEAAVVAEKFAAAEASVTGRTLPEPAVKAWDGVEAAVGKIDQAFGAPKRVAVSN